MSTYFKNGGKININQLQHLGNSVIETNAKDKTLLYTPGVLRLPTTISNNFIIEVSDATHINVGYIPANEANAPFGGVAIDKNGKTISITSNQAYVGDINSDTDIEENITFDIENSVWTPSRADDPNLNGYGPMVDFEYKRNSGNYNIPIKSGHINYVYIKYIEVVKQNASSSQTVSGISYETEYTDGYCIKIITEELDDDTWILLGQVDASGDNENNPVADNSNMQYGYLNGSTVGSPYHAQTGLYNYPTLSGSYIDLETHINALGTGIPSATNPHGISAADIGANVNNAGFTSIDTQEALADGVYDINSPLLDLTVEGAAQSYDIVLIDATNAPQNSTVAIRLPEANINTTAYKYTFRNVGESTDTVVILSSKITNTQSNQIDGGSTLVSGDTTFSYLTLTTTEPVTVVVGLTKDGYNWWRV